MIPSRNKNPKNTMTLTCIDCGAVRTVQVKDPKRIPQRCFPCNAKSGRWWGSGSNRPNPKPNWVTRSLRNQKTFRDSM